MKTFSFNEGAPMKKMKTLPATDNRIRIPSTDGKNTSKACNKELSRSTSFRSRQAMLLERPIAVQDDHFLVGVLISER